MSELVQAAKAVIDRWDAHHVVVDGTLIADLRAAVERAENQKYPPYESCAYVGGYNVGVQAERERIRSKVRIAAKKTWPAGDWYIGPQHNMIERFVEELLREDDDT